MTDEIQQLQAELNHYKCRVEELEKEVGAYKAKFDLFSGQVHEFRTPLSSIIGYSTVMLKVDYPPDEQQTAIEIIQKSGHHLLMVINTFFDFMEIETGKFQLRMEPFDLHQWGTDLHKEYKKQSKLKDGNFKWVIDSQVPARIIGDRFCIQHILDLLVRGANNAIRFENIDDSEITLSITAKQWDDSQEKDNTLYTLCFSVKDTGEPIPSNDLESMQQFFNQKGPFILPYKPDMRELEMRLAWPFGITLLITLLKRLSDVLGGIIEVESDMEAGFTTFTFSLDCEAVPE